MLADFGCRYVLVGHSERRSFLCGNGCHCCCQVCCGTTSWIKSYAVVGETLVEREAGVTHDVITRQLDAMLAVSGSAAFAHAVVAYNHVRPLVQGKRRHQRKRKM